MPTVTEALAYTRPDGNRPALAIFPVRRGEKAPAVPKSKGGHGCLDAISDETTIRRWWKDYPLSNVGIATGGTNGLLVIDIDDKPDTGKYGSESLELLTNQYGPLPTTWEAISGSGGRHLYFKMPDADIRNSEGTADGKGIAPYIDIRANGGYIIAPPSVLNDGGRYEWEASSSPEDTTLAELPPAWVQLLIEKSGPPKSRGKSAGFKLPQTVPKGGRNRTMFQYAASMRAKGVNENDMLESMRTANRDRFLPPLNDSEVVKTWESALTFPAGERQHKPALTLEALEKWLADHHITVRRDVVSHQVIVDGIGPEFDAETVNNDLHIIIHDQLKREYMGDRGLVADLLGVIAGKHRFNPVLDMLAEAPPWDGVDRIEEVYSILHIAAEDTLSRTLIRKWLYQCRSMVQNEMRGAYGADGMLALVGPQGIGKTSFCRTIGVRPQFVKLGQYIDTRDKDTTRRVTSCWIAELGEVETTLRADLERLKAFITAEIDEYRLPYGRTDQTLARRTSLIATCNSERFLIDPTGSRRFWTVPVTGIDLDALNQLDVLQLWKQVEAEINGDWQCFRLTKDEQAQLAERNTAHEKPLKAQVEIEDILGGAEAEPRTYTWRYMTVSDFKSEYPTLDRYTAEQIGRALEKLGIQAERKYIEGKQSNFRWLPHHNWHSSQQYA